MFQTHIIFLQPQIESSQNLFHSIFIYVYTFFFNLAWSCHHMFERYPGVLELWAFFIIGDVSLNTCKTNRVNVIVSGHSFPSPKLSFSPIESQVFQKVSTHIMCTWYAEVNYPAVSCRQRVLDLPEPLLVSCHVLVVSRVSLCPTSIPPRTDLCVQQETVSTVVKVANMPTISKNFLLSPMSCYKTTYLSNPALGRGSFKCPNFFFSLHSHVINLVLCLWKLLRTEVKQITQGHKADEWGLGTDPTPNCRVDILSSIASHSCLWATPSRCTK